MSLDHSDAADRSLPGRARHLARAVRVSLFLGSALGSIGFGSLLEHVGYGATFGTAGLLSFAFTGLALGALGRERVLETE